MPEPLIVNHPAVQDRLARLRDASTATPVFRRLVEELGQLLAYEATRDLPQTELELQTPVALAKVRRIATRPVVAHLGFYRDPKTLAAVPYYANLPDDLGARDVFVLDPMLATGHSGSAALTMLAERGAKAPVFVCIIAAPEGIATLAAEHPGVRIVTAHVDERLNDHGYIVPGLGDAGDRMFGSTSSVPVHARPQ